MSRNHDKDKKALLVQLTKTPIIEAACKAVGLPRSRIIVGVKMTKHFPKLVMRQSK